MTDAPLRSGQASDGPTRGSLRDDPARSEAARLIQATGLTRRQLEFCAAWARFGNHKEAAQYLGITYGTAKAMAPRVFDRLGVRSFAEAMTVLGWLRPPELGIPDDRDLERAAERAMERVVERSRGERLIERGEREIERGRRILSDLEARR